MCYLPGVQGIRIGKVSGDMTDQLLCSNIALFWRGLDVEFATPLSQDDARIAAMRGAEISAHTSLYT
jgi:hypothetical protein